MQNFFYAKFQLNFDRDEKIARKIEEPRKKATKRKAETAEIPEKFTKHVLSLGFQESDVPVLFENRDDWMGMGLESRIFCAAKNCSFKAFPSVSCLTDHCKREGLKNRFIEIFGPTFNPL